MRVRVGLFAALLLLAACDRPADAPVEESSQASGDEASGDDLLMPEDEEGQGGFAFDEDLLLEGAESLSDQAPPAECVGATAEEASAESHPRILRGLVLAPQGKLAHRTDLLELLIPSAHAAPLEGELPVADARVALYEGDARGEPAGEPLIETISDRAGQWCVRLPDGVAFGPQLLLVASAGEHRLRRPVLHANDLDLYSQPEALLRLLIEEGLTLDALSTPTYLNLDVMAQSAVDLIEPVQVEGTSGLESLLARLHKTMAEDARLKEAIARLYAE
ncbi:hypothetical protein FRC98_12530 [Lujinxingia vulgaris]|uniref:Uncharacterized protein n=1 Tax=Lujinxingia vulgaris TaxID=2600176 RepID=A0A5C6XCZ2_9DELT|nr:hypothetical protein [Lujinxingia vulgaris]TXD36649.1 hypothetical protein FRC98_12530 [Lujinxingia vulgaris]